MKHETRQALKAATAKPQRRVTIGTLDGISASDVMEYTSELNNKSIDWNDSSDRRWLMNHLHWAMNNGRTVILNP